MLRGQRSRAELLQDPAKAVAMGEAGYARLLESFTIREYMDGIHRVYRSILANQAMPNDVGIRHSTVRT